MAAAIELADRDGIESISMRRLAQALGVEAMSLARPVWSHTWTLDDLVMTYAADAEAAGQHGSAQARGTAGDAGVRGPASDGRGHVGRLIT
jgi:hypothetical protein